MGDELLPKRSPGKIQRLFMINSTYHVKYSVRNSLDKHVQSCLMSFAVTWFVFDGNFCRILSLIALGTYGILCPYTNSYIQLELTICYVYLYMFIFISKRSKERYGQKSTMPR